MTFKCIRMWGVWTQISVFGGWPDGGGGHSHYLEELQPSQLEEDLGIGPLAAGQLHLYRGFIGIGYLSGVIALTPLQGRAFL